MAFASDRESLRILLVPMSGYREHAARQGFRRGRRYSAAITGGWRRNQRHRLRKPGWQPSIRHQAIAIAPGPTVRKFTLAENSSGAHGRWLRDAARRDPEGRESANGGFAHAGARIWASPVTASSVACGSVRISGSIFARSWRSTATVPVRASGGERRLARETGPDGLLEQYQFSGNR